MGHNASDLADTGTGHSNRIQNRKGYNDKSQRVCCCCDRRAQSKAAKFVFNYNENGEVIGVICRSCHSLHARQQKKA